MAALTEALEVWFVSHVDEPWSWHTELEGSRL